MDKDLSGYKGSRCCKCQIKTFYPSFPLSQKYLNVFSGLRPDWTHSYILLKKCWYYISVSVVETDIVHGLNILWTMTFAELGIRACAKTGRKDSQRELPTYGNLRKHRSRCWGNNNLSKIYSFSQIKKTDAPFRIESVSLHLGRCLVVKIVI